MHGTSRISAHLVRSALTLVAVAVPAMASAQVTTVDFGTPGGFFGLQCITGGSPIDYSAPISGLNFGGLRTAVVGGGCVATNSGLGTNTAIITGAGGSLFSFRSANLAGAFSTTDVTVTGFLGGATVFNQALAGLPNGQTSTSLFASPDITAIDRLEITATGASASNQPFIVDNFSFAPAVVSAVPEPATLALLASGLVLVGGVGVRRRTRATA